METTTDYSQIIINTLNTLLSNLFSSIDNEVYSSLDNIAFVNENNINNNSIIMALTPAFSNTIIIIANSLLLGFTLFYAVKYMMSLFSGSSVEKPIQFIFKIIIFAIFVNSSHFICNMFIEINYYLSGSILEIGSSIISKPISFSALVQNMNLAISSGNEVLNIFSLDGLIRSFLSFGFITILFSFALRFIMIKAFMLISPFAFCSLITNSSSWFFKTWIKAFASLLLLQSFVSIILFIVFSLDITSQNIYSKLMYIGAIYALSKSFSYVRELFGGISLEISSQLSNLKTFIK